MSRYYQYKNGEEVFVRPDLERGVQYHMRSGYRANDVSATLTYSQAQRLGTVVHIAGKRNGRYYIDEDYGCDRWTDEMFVGLADESECYCESLL